MQQKFQRTSSFVSFPVPLPCPLQLYRKRVSHLLTLLGLTCSLDTVRLPRISHITVAHFGQLCGNTRVYPPAVLLSTRVISALCWPHSDACHLAHMCRSLTRLEVEPLGGRVLDCPAQKIVPSIFESQCPMSVPKVLALCCLVLPTEQAAWKRLAHPQKVSHEITRRPRNFTSRYISERIKNICLQKILQRSVHNNTVDNS